MRLSLLEAFVHAAILLLPAGISLFAGIYFWTSQEHPELTARRIAFVQWGLVASCTTTIFCFITCLEQLRTREITPGFWLYANVCAGVSFLCGSAGAIIATGRARICLVAWSVLLCAGFLGVVASTIP